MSGEDAIGSFVALHPLFESREAVAQLQRELAEQRAAELGVADRITWLGKVPHDDVGWVMSAGDVFVLPSYFEGLPMSVIEAMLTGLPVIASDIPGPREQVVDGETGLLVPARQADPLGQAMRRLAVSSP